MSETKRKAFQKLMDTWAVEEDINRKALRLSKRDELKALRLIETLKNKR